MTALEYHTSIYLEYNVQPPHSRAVQRNCRDTRYTFTPPFTTCGDLVDRLYTCLHDPATRYTRTSEAPRALPAFGAFSTTLETVLMGVACCAEPMVPF